LPQFVEQPRVLDGDDGLSGEVLQQRYLLVGERAHFLPKNGKRADHFLVFQHRHNHQGANVADFDAGRSDRFAGEKGRVLAQIGNMNWLPSTCRSGDWQRRTGLNDGTGLNFLTVCRR